MFVPSIPRDQEWSPSQRGSTSCSPPATTSISPPACPRDDSCRGRTTGGPSWTARGSEDTPASSPHLCVCVHAQRKSLCRDVRIYYLKKRKVKKRKKKKKREASDQPNSQLHTGQIHKADTCCTLLGENVHLFDHKRALWDRRWRRGQPASPPLLL